MKSLQFSFCADPLSPRRPDSAYQEEVGAATTAGLMYQLIDFEKLVADQNENAAVRRVVGSDTPQIAVYRGWMLRPEDYERLYTALQKLNVFLLNTPEAYRHCHYLPESYAVIAEHTPTTLWLPLPECLDPGRVRQALVPFGEKPLILKDYVKSRKHEWAEACYIPSASNWEAVERIVERFLELQGDDINGGLVFREYVPLQSTGRHPKSGMPLAREFRLFFLDAQLLLRSEYWAEGHYTGDKPPVGLFGEVAKKVQSRFFTMDVAQRVDGAWMIVEVGDVQVAGLSDPMCANDFYKALAGRTL